MLVTSFFSFSHNVFYSSQNKFKFFSHIYFAVCEYSQFGKDKNFVILERVDPFPNIPWFSHVCSSSLLKTLWEKEKLLIMSNVSFSHSVFYPFRELSAIFINLNCRLQSLSVWKSSKIYRLVKVEYALMLPVQHGIQFPVS